MKTTKGIIALFAVAALTGPVTGCAVYARPMVGVTYIARRPPGDRVEVIAASPGPGFVWLKGYWAYRGADFEWVPGRWERPAEGRREWVAHHWEHDRNGWYLVEGHWR